MPTPHISTATFVAEVVRGLAVLCEQETGTVGSDLAVPLGLSAWIVRASIQLPDAYVALLDLRRTIVEASGLDRPSEPFPIRVGDPNLALAALGDYLYGLVRRASDHCGLAPTSIAERVLGIRTPQLVAS